MLQVRTRLIRVPVNEFIASISSTRRLIVTVSASVGGSVDGGRGGVCTKILSADLPARLGVNGGGLAPIH